MTISSLRVEGIVFWPHGTTWDDACQSVVFENPPPALAGTTFEGGDGHYDNDTDFTGWLGAEFGDAITECQNKTDALGVLFAYATPNDVS